LIIFESCYQYLLFLKNSNKMNSMMAEFKEKEKKLLEDVTKEKEEVFKLSGELAKLDDLQKQVQIFNRKALHTLTN
jgi:hypothetical protein